MSRPLYGVIHPVAPDEHYTFAENMNHSLFCYRTVLEAGFDAFMPWHTMVLVVPDTDPVWRERGLTMDEELISRMDGVIAVGHRMSPNMLREWNTFELRGNTRLSPEQAFIDMIGVPDSRLLDELKKLNGI